MVRWCVFNATFNNISALSWRLAVLVDEIGVPVWKKDTDLAQIAAIV